VAVAAVVLLASCSSNGDHTAPTAGSSATAEAAAATTAAGSSPVDASAPATSGVAAPSTSASTSTVEATTTTVDPPAPEACALFTPDEASFVVGAGTVFKAGVADAPQDTPYGTHTACTWTAERDSGTTIRVSVWDDATAFDDAKAQVGVTGDVAGIGDRAFAATLASIYAVARGHTVFVQYSNLDQDDAANLPVTTNLATLAASRL